MKNLKKRVLLSSTFLAVAFSSALSGYFTSDEFKLWHHEHAHYAFDADPELDGIYAQKFVKPSDNKYADQKTRSMSTIGDIESVWNNYTGAGTKIAIIDDGFDTEHPEYKRANGTSAILPQSRYYYRFGNDSYHYQQYSEVKTCLEEDWNDKENKWDTHGTNSSTTAAAPMGNTGGVGIAPDADMLLLKIDMSFAAIKGAISYAVSQGVDVINMSLGAYATSFTDGFNESQTGSSVVATCLDEVCEEAYENNVIVVAAAGNEATSTKSYPACSPHVIGVGALAKNSTNLAPFTNFNTSTTQEDEKNVDILAPGYVYTAARDGTQSYPTHTYIDTQGTSFASPIVAGAACLWKQKNPTGTPSQFEYDLTTTASGIGDYVDAKVNPATAYNNSNYKNNLDSNLACGRLNVGALLALSHTAESIEISESSKTLYKTGGKGEHSFKISAEVKPGTADNQNITWKSSDSSVVSLSKTSSTSGEQITASAGTKTGTATLTATSVDGGFTATCQVTVNQWINVSSFSISDGDNQKSGTLLKNHTLQLNVNVSPSNATDGTVIFTSSDEDVATVTDDGLITAKAEGTTTIEALCSDDDDCFYDSYELEVTAPQGLGSFVIDLYDSSTLNDTNSTNTWTKDSLNNRVTVNGVADNGIISKLEQEKCYKRAGGALVGSSGKSGNVKFTLNAGYEAESVTLVGTVYDSSKTFTLNGQAGTGELNPKGTDLSDCSMSLVWTDLGGVSELNFATANGRAGIYQITVEFASGSDTPVTPTPTNYNVSFNANGGQGQMSNDTTNGSTYTTPDCTFTYSGHHFTQWALNSATSNTKYAKNTTIQNITSDITLYALWEADSGSGSGGSDTPSSYTGTYYNGVNTSSADALRSWLHTKINTGTVDVGYNGLWDAYKTTDVKANGRIWDMYSNYEFIPGTQQASGTLGYSKEGDCYNREHTIPQSWFNESAPMVSDLFHVYPTDGYVNNRRSNYPHGNVGNATYTSQNGSKLGTSSCSGVSGTVFEPIDQYKGDFARTYFYFALRYYDKIGSFTDNPVFVEEAPYISSGYLNMYYEWHKADVVSQKEVDRNNAVEGKQKNRNPFIDHPEWVDYIFKGISPTGGDTGDDDVAVTGVTVTPATATISVGATQQLTATVEPANATNKNVTWSSDNNTVATVSSSGLVTAVAAGTANITAKTVDGGFEESSTITVTGGSITPVTSQTYTLEFNNRSDDESQALDADKVLSKCAEDNTLVSSVTSATNIFAGKTGIKLGSGSKTGSITFSLKSEAQSNITGIDIYSTQYGSDTGYLKYTLGSETGTKAPGQSWSDTFTSAVSATTLTIETSAKRAYLSKIVIKVGSSSATPLTSISAVVDPNYNIYVGDTLDESKISVTGNNGTQLNNFTVTGFDSSNAGTNTVTISYNDNGNILTCPLDLTINAVVLNSISASCSKTFKPGDTFNSSYISVTGSFNNGNRAVTEFECSIANDYVFTYNDVGTKQLSVSYGGKDTTVSLTINKNTYTVPAGKTTEFSGSDFSGLGSSVTSTTLTIKETEFSFTNCYCYESQLSLNKYDSSNKGSFYNTTAFKQPIKTIELGANGSNTNYVKISVSKDGITWVNYSSTVVASADYYFMKMYCDGTTRTASRSEVNFLATNKYINIKSFSVEYFGLDTALTLADYVMDSDTVNQCLTKFDIARSKYLAMSETERNNFRTSNEYTISVARERYEAWAVSLHKNPYSEGDSGAPSVFNIGKPDNNTILIIALTAIGLISVSGFYLYSRKRKYQ